MPFFKMYTEYSFETIQFSFWVFSKETDTHIWTSTHGVSLEIRLWRLHLLLKRINQHRAHRAVCGGQAEKRGQIDGGHCTYIGHRQHDNLKCPEKETTRVLSNRHGTVRPRTTTAAGDRHIVGAVKKKHQNYRQGLHHHPPQGRGEGITIQRVKKKTTGSSAASMWRPHRNTQKHYFCQFAEKNSS